eukprot:3294065-Prorocentrum_lima.AAC.1
MPCRTAQRRQGCQEGRARRLGTLERLHATGGGLLSTGITGRNVLSLWLLDHLPEMPHAATKA